MWQRQRRRSHPYGAALQSGRATASAYDSWRRMSDIAILSGIFAVIAALYASVGQAGGTGYVAVMGLLNYGPDVIKPTALALNILVAAIGCWRFARAGFLTWRTCYPFAILGAPFSVIGGATHLPPALYQPFVGALLLLAGMQMIGSAPSAAQDDRKTPTTPPFIPSVLAGAGIGFVSGVTGVGGGIFLAPLVLTFGWIETRQASAVSAVFNLLNSGAAMAGVWATMPSLPSALPWWLIAVAIGGFLGSWFGVPTATKVASNGTLAAAIAFETGGRRGPRGGGLAFDRAGNGVSGPAGRHGGLNPRRSGNPGHRACHSSS
jgi:uncharacterized protein